jgi:hypothetical protein
MQWHKEAMESQCKASLVSLCAMAKKKFSKKPRSVGAVKQADARRLESALALA